MPIVNSTIEARKAFTSTDGPHLTKFIGQEEGESHSFWGIELSVCVRQGALFQKVKDDFIDRITDNLRNRFPILQASVLSAFSVLDLKASGISSAKREGMLTNLLEHFGRDREGFAALVDANKCSLEMHLLVPMVRNNFSGFSVQDLWGVVSDKYSDQFPELLKLAQIAMLIPITTTDCDWGFSYQNNIKVKSQARLSSANVDQLMRVCIIN